MEVIALLFQYFPASKMGSINCITIYTSFMLTITHTCVCVCVCVCVCMCAHAWMFCCVCFPFFPPDRYVQDVAVFGNDIDPEKATV